MFKRLLQYIIVTVLSTVWCRAEQLKVSVASATFVGYTSRVEESPANRTDTITIHTEQCSLLKVVVDIENSLDRVISHIPREGALFYLPQLCEVPEASGCLRFPSVSTAVLYGVDPADVLPAARTRREMTFLVFHTSAHELKFRLTITIPNRSPELKVFSEVFCVEAPKSEPNQALERNVSARHVGCCAPAAPVRAVAHL
jgi:hypothetical protein